MLKSSINTLLNRVPSKYSPYTLQAKRAHEFEAGARPTQEFKSIKVTLQALEKTESSNAVTHPNPEAERAAALARTGAERLAKEEEERKIKEQVTREKEEGEKI